MDTEKSIATEIFKDYSLTEKEITLINSKFERVELKKGENLLTPNSVVNERFYIYSGCLRSYFIDRAGKESTIQFAIKDWWISDYTLFFTDEKTVTFIECIEDAVVYKISEYDVDVMFTSIPKLETFFRKKLERALASFQKRILEHLTLSAKERYLKFIKSYPKIDQCVKNYHIASYLGITTESLSRVRKSIPNL